MERCNPMLTKRLTTQRTKTIETRIQRSLVIQDCKIVQLGQPRVTTKTLEDVEGSSVHIVDHPDSNPTKFYFGSNMSKLAPKDKHLDNIPEATSPLPYFFGENRETD